MEEIKANQVWNHNKSGQDIQIHSYNPRMKEVILLTWGLMIIKEEEFREKFSLVR